MESLHNHNVSDPAQNTANLNQVLRTLGLYAADTLGDGNCLFRALSDQLYGSPSRHVEVRRDVCDWIEHHADNYSGFIEEEGGIDTHLRNMRELGTYGGHLELSAFSHLHRRNVKVIQPGLIYIIEWAASTPSSDEGEASTSKSKNGADSKRVTRREAKRLEQLRQDQLEEEQVLEELVNPDDVDESEDESDDPADPSEGAVYVAYHNWEHFSSIRNLRGPHAGLPNVREAPAPSAQASPPRQKTSKSVKRESEKPKTRANAPTNVPLPPSRPDSPSISVSPPTPMITSTDLLPKRISLQSTGTVRASNSPKRTFDESSGASSASDSYTSRSRSKRTRSQLREEETETDADVDVESTPSLSIPSSQSLSSLSPPPDSPPLVSDPPPRRDKTPTLTRRQRKALGLPKPRYRDASGRLVAAGTAGAKIVIPGGKFQRSSTKASDPATEPDVGGEEGEWRTNGAGRLDVRGFRELKI